MKINEDERETFEFKFLLHINFDSLSSQTSSLFLHDAKFSETNFWHVPGMFKFMRTVAINHAESFFRATFTCSKVICQNSWVSS